MPPFFVSIPGALATLGVLVLVVHGAVSGRAAVSRPAAPNRPSGRPTMQVVISLAVLATALYIVIARPEASDDHKWAYGIMGTVVGYWLAGR